ncbi:MAG: 1-acyl-sn-glycerol-3-phosphate acyltransferase [Colwelliaceae bacterium]|nr:1-acyl-sn-glycerol-3-phosphate acyltransferase [Colwelliaceae bacterium]
MLPIIPTCIPQTQYRFLRFLAEKSLALTGWNITGRFPQKSKFILAVAPHTSNWDFIISMLVMLALNLKVTFMGKSSIFVWPVKGLLIKLGGVAIERNHPNGIVGQMVSLFNDRHCMVLGLSPEGTRSKTKEWKTGFLIIASKANVPIVPISLDFKKKEVKINNEYYVGNDIDQALIEVKGVFADVCAKNPHLV